MNPITVQSPGRINIIGEHTDYNNGFVLPAAIQFNTRFTLTKNASIDNVNIYAKNLDEHFSFTLQQFEPIDNGWQNYLMGVVNELQKLDANLTGFDAIFHGDVPIGSGLSSSASLECSLAFGLNELFDLQLKKSQLIKACQMAEHNFVGIKCGIMDQFASVMGKKNQVIKLDCKTLEYSYFPFDLQENQLLLINTNVTHALASSEYNSRRSECREAVEIMKHKYPKIDSLRDVNETMLQANIQELSSTIFRRCKHVIYENTRVLKATKALENADFVELGQLMYQSHDSLQNDYEVSCPELDFLVDFTRNHDYILGSRMMGGGFGGCTINIVEKNKIEHFKHLILEAYFKEFGIKGTCYEVEISDGSKLVNTE